MTGAVNYVGECGRESYLCGLCEGDCDTDADCQGDLRCALRNGPFSDAAVPGCTGENGHRDVYAKEICFQPVSAPRGVLNYVGECGQESYLCGLCEGDCDTDDDCEGNLTCHIRSGFDPVPGCFDEGRERDMYGRDMCIAPPIGIA